MNRSFEIKQMRWTAPGEGKVMVADFRSKELRISPPASSDFILFRSRQELETTIEELREIGRDLWPTNADF